MVHAARQIADFGIKRSTHRHIHLLKPPAHTEKRLSALDAGAHQRQRDPVTAPVEIAMRGGRRLAIFFRVHIRPTASQQEPVTGLQQILDRHIARIRRHQQRHRTRNIGHRGHVHHAAGMNGVGLAQHGAVADDPDNRTLV